MGKHRDQVNSLMDNGFDKQDATEIADTTTLNRILDDEDEQYIREEIIVEENDGDLDGYTDDTISDFEYDEDEEVELSFDDEGLNFLDEESDEY